MEQFFDALGTGIGNSVTWMADHGVLFLIFAVLWVALAVGLVWSQGTVDQAWHAIGELPLVLKAIVWVLFLPVMIGVWVWETTWPIIVRIVLVAAIAGWNLWMFLPRALTAKP